MKNTIFLLIYFSLFYSALRATDIKGRLIDLNTKKPIEFATTVLLKSDSTYITGSQTDIAGSFLISAQIQKHDYILKASYVGYRTIYIKINNLSTNIDFGDIELSEDSKALKEVTVTANHIVNKVDRQIILPDSMQIKSSVNAFDLLSNMSLARLNIDPVNRSIKIGTEDVQLRINGVRASTNEIVALRPQDILRLEYFEDPGVRFGNENVGAVINFILKRERKSGGYVSLDAQNAPFVGFGNDNITFKTNYKASEFGLSYYAYYRSYDDTWVDLTESFIFPDKKITREQKGIKDIGRNQNHYINLTYNLTILDKYVFNVVLKDGINKSNWQSSSNNYYSNNATETYQKNDPKTSFNSPSLDIYYRRELNKKQSVAINIVGTYIDSESKTKYFESQNGTVLTDIFNQVEGNKYSIIGEAIYEKLFEKHTLSAGIKHTQGFADNTYMGNTNTETNMKNADSYAFAQIQGKIANKLSYTLGLGGTRLWVKESDNNVKYFIFRPSVQFSYSVKDLTMKYSFRVNPSIPSLGQLSNIEQQIDSFRVNKGNPLLKPFNRYINRMEFSYNKGLLNTSLYLNYTYSNKPYVNEYSIINNKIYSSSINQKYGHFLTAYLDVKLNLIKNIWTLRGWGQISRSIFEGNNYIHTFNALYGGIQSNLIYRNLTLNVMASSRFKDLWGEVIYLGENWNYIEAGYKHKEAKFAIGMTHAFTASASEKSRNLSSINPSEKIMNFGGTVKMLYLRLSWNISFGRKHQAGEKRLNNADTDKGIL